MGWIRLHRQIVESWTYADSDYFKIWVTMLIRASHKEHDQLIGNRIVKLKPGDFVFGRLQWERDLGIKGWKLQKATALMVQQSMISPVSRNSKLTIYHVDNYEKYQQQQQQQENEEECGKAGLPQQQGQHESNSRATAEQQQSNTNNKGKKDKKDKKDICTSPDGEVTPPKKRNRMQELIEAWEAPDTVKAELWKFISMRGQMGRAVAIASVPDMLEKLRGMGWEMATATIKNTVANGFTGLVPPDGVKQGKATEGYRRYGSSDGGVSEDGF